jgi:hypothetical protein
MSSVTAPPAMTKDEALKAAIAALQAAPDAAKELDSDGDGKPDAAGIKAFFQHNGEFSKTAVFAVVGNVLVLGTYAIQTWIGGASFDLGFIKGAIPTFQPGDAAAILSIVNATYVARTHVAGKAAPEPAA